MKRISLLALATLLVASPLFAQDWTVAARYGSYEATTDLGTARADLDRKGSGGALIEFRQKAFVFRGELDRDSESNASPSPIPESWVKYKRDRWEISGGWAALPYMDLEAGFRADSADIDAFGFFGDFSAHRISADSRAGLLGVRFHSTESARIAWYGSIRGYVGTMDVTEAGYFDDSVSATGFRIVAGFPIAVGANGWFVTPGAEFERIDTADIGTSTDSLRLESNRFFISVGYSFRR